MEATDQAVYGKFNILSFSQGFKNGLDLYANNIQLTFVYDRKNILSSSRQICQNTAIDFILKGIKLHPVTTQRIVYSSIIFEEPL